MSRDSAPRPSATPAHRQWRGYAALLVLVSGSAAWLSLQSRISRPAATPVSVQPAHSSGVRFRSDAWQLPDESLLGFVEIPAGSFLMGSDPSVDSLAYANERWSQQSNRGSLELPMYYIARYETTVGQLAAFASATGYVLDARTWQLSSDHPATYVSWTDALAYARWLQATLQRSPHTPAALQQLLNDGWQLTLPSEAEWEKAARGSDGRIYPWGEVAVTAYANFGAAGPKAVGSLPCAECAFGLADMSGNVWELTRSPLQSYPFDVSERRVDLQTDALFVMRGGAFNDAANNVRAATRGGVDPGARRPFIGFRLVLRPGATQ